MRQQVPFRLKKLLHYAPIAAQFCKTKQEECLSKDELFDPIGDRRHQKSSGLIHRYPNRILLLPTEKCFVHCRFCFRKCFKESKNVSKFDLDFAINYLKTHPNINEIILTGGDPICAPLPVLKEICSQISKIKHIKHLRIHTRALIAKPKVIDKALIDCFVSSEKVLWWVNHINSDKELDKDLIAYIQLLKSSGFSLMAQSVLLKNINDTQSKLIKLLQKITDFGIKPYYLHFLDPAPGTGHFAVSLISAVSLLKNLRGKISGHSIPNLMIELPNGEGKVVIDEQNIQQDLKLVLISPLSGKKIELNHAKVRGAAG